MPCCWLQVAAHVRLSQQQCLSMLQDPLALASETHVLCGGCMMTFNTLRCRRMHSQRDLTAPSTSEAWCR